jgi:hypothetical protein
MIGKRRITPSAPIRHTRNELYFELAGSHRVPEALGALPAMPRIVRHGPTATKILQHEDNDAMCHEQS